jgi:hypothetical protein
MNCHAASRHDGVYMIGIESICSRAAGVSVMEVELLNLLSFQTAEDAI